MSGQAYDDTTMIRWALTHAMTEQTVVFLNWNCLTLIANGNHVAFSELSACSHKDQVSAIMKATTEIWRELHPRTVD